MAVIQESPECKRERWLGKTSAPGSHKHSPTTGEEWGTRTPAKLSQTSSSASVLQDLQKQVPTGKGRICSQSPAQHGVLGHGGPPDTPPVLLQSRIHNARPPA